VLDAATASEEGVVEARHVPGGVDVRHVGAKALVDEDAVVDRYAAALEEGHGGLDAHADDGQACAELAPGVELNRVEA